MAGLIVGVMATETERNWTAHVVIASEHAGLNRLFKLLEHEVVHALARIDDPRQVREYITALRFASLGWRGANSFKLSRK